MATVFLSYRRNESSYVARSVLQALRGHGFDVFMDVEDIDAGRFENVILNEIDASEHFVVLLTTATAEALGRLGDWVTQGDAQSRLRRSAVL